MNTIQSDNNNFDLALISQPEVLKLFGVSPMTLWRWRKAKGFPPEVRVASRVYFRRSDVAKFLDANTAKDVFDELTK